MISKPQDVMALERLSLKFNSLFVKI